jgi:hypothetical protein
LGCYVITDINPFNKDTTKKMVISGDFELPLFWWLVKVGRKCKIAATIFVAANKFFFRRKILLKLTLGSPVMT